jgi:plastocyanin
MRTRLLIAPVLLLAALAAAAPASAQDHEVDVVDFAFTPESLQIDPGDTVVWTFTAGGHTTTAERRQAETWNSDPSGSGFNSAGDRFSHTFATPGRYQYVCIPHAGFMTGVVQVGADRFRRSQTRFRQRRRGRTLTFSFRLREPAEVTVRLRGASRRTVTRRRLETGSHSIRLARLREGRYRGTVTFVDDFDMRSVIRTRAVIR